ncbi:fatty acid synthase-like [Polistes fuscatus]|uniref:fatty acid synthase-like n=1 Tax=Polistes fuscatus TaxID=30207 RepID=UPI001CA90938|nr:fatty acid synthase-like [Polistes fuscatus]
MIAQAYQLTANEILCTPSTSNLLMTSAPSPQPVIIGTKIVMNLAEATIINLILSIIKLIVRRVLLQLANMEVEGLDENAVVISGISGKFPKSDNINYLTANLLNGEDCVSEDNTSWKLGHSSEISSRLGRIFNLTKFDNFFFGISAIQAKFLSPEIRMAMEVTFEAIIDAGINPVELRNKKTNVYGVLSLYESDSYLLKDKTQENGYSLLGYCRGLLSNRISFCMGLTGSNCTVDSSCTSSSLAIQKAYDEAINAGDCEYAIVSGCILSLLPQTSHQLYELGKIRVY